MLNNDLIKKILSDPRNDNFDGYNKQTVLDCKVFLIEEGYADGLISYNSETAERFVQVAVIKEIKDKGKIFIENV